MMEQVMKLKQLILVFIAINGTPAGYKSVRKLLKTTLVKKYGIHNYTHF